MRSGRDEPGSHVAAAWSRTSDVQRRSWKYSAAEQERTTDLVIVGGGLSGVAAACAAARRNCKVILVEDLHMLGGQASTSAVAAFDVTMHYHALLNQHGIWSEFLELLREEYDALGLPMNTARYREDSLAANPIVIDQALTRMIQQDGIPLLRRTTVTGAEHHEDHVRIETTRGPILAKYVMDATEDGSVLPLIGARRRTGNIESEGIAEPLDRNPFIQDITQVAVIRLQPDGLDDRQVVPKPASYKKMRSRIASFYPNDPSQSRRSPVGFAGYRAMPDIAPGASPYTGTEWEKVTRTSLNFINDHPVRASYLTDPAARSRFEKGATMRTMAVLYYLQSELKLPWALVEDEGYGAFADSPRFPRWRAYQDFVPLLPPRPYIRESIRGVGLDTLTGKDIFRRANRTMSRWNVDAIAVGTYPPDLHGGRTQSALEPALGENLADKPTKWREGPFPIPVGTLISASHPRVFFAEKNISTSRIASGATRLHPTVMAIGEAAGTLAAISVVKRIDPARVPSLAVQASILHGGALPAPLALGDVRADDPLFPHVGLAIARNAHPYRVLKAPNKEPFIETDVRSAAEVGKALEAPVSALILIPKKRR